MDECNGTVGYHLSVKAISRTQGRSATAAAAYRSGGVIIDERTGETHDYRRKQGILSTEIVLPAGAPDWMQDREQLWNAVEQAETRKNSNVAREIVVAVPYGLWLEDGIDLVQEFAQKIADYHQCAVDIAIHKDSGRDWQGQVKGEDGCHAHLMITTRQVEATGLGAKTREWNNRSAKAGVTGSETVRYWREQWANLGNRYLEEAGLEATLDHRSYEEQGLEQEATVHLGVAATAMERRGMKTNLGQLNRSVQGSNGDIEQAQETLGQVEQELAQAFAQEVQLREELARVEQEQLEERQAQQEEWVEFNQALLEWSGKTINAKERRYVGGNYVVQGTRQDFEVIAKQDRRLVLVVAEGKVTVDGMTAQDLEHIGEGISEMKWGQGQARPPLLKPPEISTGGNQETSPEKASPLAHWNKKELLQRSQWLYQMESKSRPKPPELKGYGKVEAEREMAYCKMKYGERKAQQQEWQRKWFKSREDKEFIEYCEQEMKAIASEYEQLDGFLTALEKYEVAYQRWNISPEMVQNRAEQEQLRVEIQERALKEPQEKLTPPVRRERGVGMEL